MQLTSHAGLAKVLSYPMFLLVVIYLPSEGWKAESTPSQVEQVLNMEPVTWQSAALPTELYSIVPQLRLYYVNLAWMFLILFDLMQGWWFSQKQNFNLVIDKLLPVSNMASSRSEVNIFLRPGRSHVRYWWKLVYHQITVLFLRKSSTLHILCQCNNWHIAVKIINGPLLLVMQKFQKL